MSVTDNLQRDNPWNNEEMASAEPMIEAEDLDFGDTVDQIDATRPSRSVADLVNEYRRKMPVGRAPQLHPKVGALVQHIRPENLYYRISGEKLQGRAVIINNKRFIGEQQERSGSDVDAINMLCALDRLGFQTEVYENVTVRDLSEIIHKITRDPNNINGAFDMFAMIILSHGTQNEKQQDMLVTSDSQEIPFKEILSQFSGSLARSWATKPKLFFIQACRGEKTDAGLTLMADSMDGGDFMESEQMDETDARALIRTITVPAEADIFVAYSTPPGYYSWRSPEAGSYFIQLLANRLYREGAELNYDLNTIVTLVCNDLVQFSSNVPANRNMHMKKQVPWISSTLTKFVKFRKQNSSAEFNI